MQYKSKISMLFVAAVLTGCSAIPAHPEAENVELVNTAPDAAKCRFIKEIVGSQGNFLTGDFTPNEDLVIGARNELRNKAHQHGANVVYIQDMKNTNAYGSLGTTNTTVVGKAYFCKK
ncbi:DUF4156 domain-containing protein [Shewanella sp. OPT22]|nr:DUF4156 domain-containing protein [Shewanella sp. OPT22]